MDENRSRRWKRLENGKDQQLSKRRRVLKQFNTKMKMNVAYLRKKKDIRDTSTSFRFYCYFTRQPAVPFHT